MSGVCSIVADCHFPIIVGHSYPSEGVSSSSLIKPSSMPFRKPQNVNGILTTSLSCIAYFEVKIHNSGEAEVPFENITIGIANSLFSLVDSKPGDDYNSYGIKHHF